MYWQAVLSLALSLVSYVLDPLAGLDGRPGIVHPRTRFPLYTSMLLGMQARARRAATRTYKHTSQRASEPSGSMPSCLGSSPTPVTPLPNPLPATADFPPYLSPPPAYAPPHSLDRLCLPMLDQAANQSSPPWYHWDPADSYPHPPPAAAACRCTRCRSC